jgi:hypothetical protein
MKYLFLLAALCLSFSFTSAQNVIEKHFQSYADQEDITEVFVSGQLFKYAAHFVDDEDFGELEEVGVEDAKDFILSIQSFQLIKVPEIADANSEYNRGLSKISNSHEELIVVRDNNNQFSLHVDENNGIVSELVGIGISENEFIVFSLLGEMDFDNLGKLVSKIQMENFAKNSIVSEIDIDEMKVYPNPASTEGILNIDVPQSMIGGNARLYDINGNVIQQFKIEQQQQKLQAEGLTPGYYVVELQKDAVSMKKKVLVAR